MGTYNYTKLTHGLLLAREGHLKGDIALTDKLIGIDKPKLHLVTPATDTTGPDDPVWLKNMKVFDVFFARPKGSRLPFVLEYEVINIYNKIYKLRAIEANGPDQDVYQNADPIQFSAQFELIEVIRSQEQEEDHE